MLYWTLFWIFLKIGAVSFGGGYAMIPLIREEMLTNGWLTETELLDFIAIAESTPGPIAVNMATFVGASQAGIPGALLATLGVVLPSFCIILLIAAVLRNLMQYTAVRAFLRGIRPAVVAMILATAVMMLWQTFFSIQETQGMPVAVDGKGVCIFGILIACHLVYKKIRKKRPSPIGMILVSAGLGILFYAV